MSDYMTPDGWDRLLSEKAELEAELEKVRQDKASNDRDYLRLSAEHAASMGRIAQLEEKLQVHQEWHKMAGNENAALKDTLKAVRGELEAKYRFMVDSAQQNGRERDAATERVGELTQLNRKLVDALGDVFALMSFESGPFLGRITDHDGEPGWAMRMIEPMAKLKAAHAVLDEAKEALNSSPRQAEQKTQLNYLLNAPATIEWTEADDDRVCHALWDAGFCGTESAERGPIMIAAKRIAREAFYANRQVTSHVHTGASKAAEEQPERDASREAGQRLRSDPSVAPTAQEETPWRPMKEDYKSPHTHGFGYCSCPSVNPPETWPDNVAKATQEGKEK